MTDAIEDLAQIGINAQVDLGPSPGIIVLEAALPDGTVLAIYPGQDDWWPMSEDPSWAFTGWSVLHYDPESDQGVSDPIGSIQGLSVRYAPQFASPQALADLVGAYLRERPPSAT